jgi:hypothetical protein
MAENEAPQPTADPLIDLYVQTVRAMESQASATRELTGAIERGFQATQLDHRNMIDAGANLRDEVTRLSTAIEARTAVLSDLSKGFLGVIQKRWVMLLIGLGTGLGLAGARELLGVLLGQVVAGGAAPV